MSFRFAGFQFEESLDRLNVDFPEINTEIILYDRLIRALNIEKRNNLNQFLNKQGMNESQWYALLAVYFSEGQEILPSELSEALNLTRTSATRLSDEMVKMGWVNRFTHPIDRRKITLKLTQKGVDMVHKLIVPVNRLRQNAWLVLTEEEQKQMYTFLQKMFTQTVKSTIGLEPALREFLVLNVDNMVANN
ncbi:MarR family transcriptional regulator [Stenoxybacter acetivorans]|uniref:MarR family transcriptional regulator n=1 Tax=Stenoxybacter acetivorans TaxID=422441 RepID=UPI000689CF18|nr:MarR family transcriptional regulator [Stenoxybacter acetivorans]